MYRERAAGMYNELPFALAQCVIELPYNLLQVGCLFSSTYPLNMHDRPCLVFLAMSIDQIRQHRGLARARLLRHCRSVSNTAVGKRSCFGAAAGDPVLLCGVLDDGL